MALLKGASVRAGAATPATLSKNLAYLVGSELHCSFRGLRTRQQSSQRVRRKSGDQDWAGTLEVRPLPVAGLVHVAAVVKGKWWVTEGKKSPKADSKKPTAESRNKLNQGHGCGAAENWLATSISARTTN